MVTHDLSEAFTLATRVIALDRVRKRPEERERFGATIINDIEVWPRRFADPDLQLQAIIRPGRDDPAHSLGTSRDGPVPA
jgi:NitT/TauT family transport system ATP-binding protein